MGKIVISVRGIGKKYRYGFTHGNPNHRTLRDTVVQKTQRFADGLKRIAAKRNPLPQKIPSAVLCPPSSDVRRPTSEPHEFWALKDVSFDVNEGQVLGIIGPNGAGKSTLLKLLSQITEPTEGEIRIKGRVASLLEVGTGFHQELSGRENVFMNGAILGMSKAEIKTKFDEIVAFAGVEKFIDTPVKRYSSGMHVRLAFAVAAHLEPEILLIDEVLAVGDASFQKKCLRKMQDVGLEGRTVLFVSHNMGAMRKLCSRCILLEGGKIVLDSSPEQSILSYLGKLTDQASVEVALPPGKKDAPAEAKCLRFFDEDGKPNITFRLYESWGIVLEFVIYEKLPQVIAAVGLANSDSVPIITYWSKPNDLEPGRYFVRFQCDVELKSCDLNLSVGLSSREKTFYYVSGVGHVTISEVAKGSQPLRASGAGILLSQQEHDIEINENEKPLA